MNTKQPEQQSLNISQDQLLEFVRTMIGGSREREDDQHPLPPGPWDPVIRAALEQIRFFGAQSEPGKVFGQGPLHWRATESVVNPMPEPWKVVLETIFRKHPEAFDAMGGGQSFGETVTLNPQPLPPRYAFLIAVTQAVIRRAELFQEIADALSNDGSERGIIIVSGYVTRFVDDWCGTEFKLRWLFPGPRPHWFSHELDGIDLLVMATQFEQAAKETFSPDMRKYLGNASAQFVAVGMSRIQNVLDRTGYASQESSPTRDSAA